MVVAATLVLAVADAQVEPDALDIDCVHISLTKLPDHHHH